MDKVMLPNTLPLACLSKVKGPRSTALLEYNDPLIR